MKSFQKIIRIIILILFANGFLTNYVFAQPDPCTDPTILDCSCPDQASNPLCPIDSGVYYLLAAGLGYGIIRIRKQRKKNVPA